MRRAYRHIAMALAALLMLLSFSGCRPSDALSAIVYNQEAETVSQDDALIHNSEENTIQDETIFSVAEVENSSNSRGWTNDVAQYGEGNDGEAVDAAYYESADDLYTTAQTISREEWEALQGEDDLEEEEDQQPEDEELPQEDEESSQEMVSDDGDEAELEARAGTVAAVGEAAVLVQMLGGPGTLAAVSEDFLENELLQRVFAEEGVSEIPALWSGDGSTPLDDESFAALLALEPAVCFAVTGEETFTEEQIAALREQGIEYVVLPALTSSSGILTAVSVTGQTLGDRTEDGGLDSAALAEDYLRWHADLLEDLSSRTDIFTSGGVDFDNTPGAEVKYLSRYATSGTYTLYLSGWDAGVTYSISTVSYVVLEEQGLPVTVKGYVGSPLSYYMSLAGVLNKAASAFVSTKAESWYVHPIRSVSHIKAVSGGAEGVGFNNTNGSQTSFLTEGLGGVNYPALVTASASIKEALENSAVWSGETIYDQDGREVTSTIQGNYDIYVNPQGVGNWAAGSAESPLEAVWAGWRLSGIFTEEELSAYIADFYSRFYRYSLTTADLAEILAGDPG